MTANKTLERSFIREILNVTQRPEVISFAGGLPDPDMFPVQALQQATNEVFEQQGNSLLQYSVSEGIPELREWIAARQQEKGLSTTSSTTLITHGAQQGIDLAAGLLLAHGDTVLLEAPGYLGAIQVFKARGINCLSVSLDEDGPNLEQLETILRHQKIKAFYAVPNFQNPTGLTWSNTKREAIATLLQRYGVWLIEDDPYGDLRYRGNPLPPISNFAPDNSIYLGSFSKTVAPALRLGWLNAPSSLFADFVTLKQSQDLHTSSFTQHILLQFLQSSQFPVHLQRLRDAYGERLEIMCQALRRHLPEGADFTQPSGGMFVWVKLTEGIDTMKLFERAIAQNVAFVPGECFYLENVEKNRLRLNFSNVTATTIETGITRIGSLFD